MLHQVNWLARVLTVSLSKERVLREEEMEAKSKSNGPTLLVVENCHDTTGGRELP